ncbi:hypothetical protein [Oricola thermophila]|uniref:Uncharacterized protein n=1 Tax=Oricola thermophila TaxID=2742145 RepID=A0A6N1VDV0_9HYPH|nr:hypothetical protein [Oricola thermophila]QKV17785.1 hypothetical protein HTY61_04585 [Oricola thermophila]
MSTTEDRDLEGITLGAGNSVAANSALQIIDPWPSGVQDTDLVVPAERGGTEATGNGGSNAGSGATTSLAE